MTAAAERAHRLPVLVTWFDIDGIRYLMVRERSRLHVGPADHAKIERRKVPL
jgi:hypothetical protein